MSKSMFATARAAGSADAAAASLVADLQRGLGGAAPCVVWVFASTAQPLEAVSRSLSAAFPGATILGASTAGEFTETGDAKSSVAAAALAGDYRVHAGMSTGLAESVERAVAGALAELPAQVEGYPCATGIVLVDPLAGRGEEASLLVASSLPEGVRLVGGAAGDDLQMKRALVSLGDRAASDALVVCVLFSKSPLGIGVAHAHEPFSRPLLVTRAEGNVVHQIDGRPAWDVWREVTRERAKARGFDVDALPASDEGRFLLLFEGALSIGASGGRELHKIRAPLSRTPEGALSFACGIMEGASLRVSESIAARQVSAACEAARTAAGQLEGPPLGAVVFDCICRNIILGDEFGVAVRGMSEALSGAPLAGFETYGEIALDVGDMSGFHNTTTVVLAFPS